MCEKLRLEALVPFDESITTTTTPQARSTRRASGAPRRSSSRTSHCSVVPRPTQARCSRRAWLPLRDCLWCRRAWCDLDQRGDPHRERGRSSRRYGEDSSRCTIIPPMTTSLKEELQRRIKARDEIAKLMRLESPEGRREAALTLASGHKAPAVRRRRERAAAPRRGTGMEREIAELLHHPTGTSKGFVEEPVPVDARYLSSPGGMHCPPSSGERPPPKKPNRDAMSLAINAQLCHALSPAPPPVCGGTFRSVCS
ncbi:hypothetical protein QF040_006668 [Variovorax sp. W2I14]